MCMQAEQGREEMDRILTLLAVQERLGLAAEGPMPPAALAKAALQVHPESKTDPCEAVALHS